VQRWSEGFSVVQERAALLKRVQIIFEDCCVVP